MTKVKQASQVNQVNWAKLFSHFFYTLASLSTTIVLQALSQNGQGPTLTWQYIEVTETTADGQNISHRDLWSQISLPGRQTRADRSICLPGISGHLISCFFHISQFPFLEAAPPLESTDCAATENSCCLRAWWPGSLNLFWVLSLLLMRMYITHLNKYHKYTAYMTQVISSWQFYFLHVSPNDGERAQRASAN